MMIKVENIKKTFEKNEVLKGVSFDLPDKGLVSIFGKSGSGKTTLLNIMGGLEYPDSGSVYINGESLKKHKDKIRNENIGFIFQNYYLESGYTISEIMHNAMAIAGFKDPIEIERRSNEVLKIVDLERYKFKEASALSGGQKQRVAIARALIKGADIILADEPTGNLDAINTYKVMNILKAISKDRLVVLVTHEVSLIREYADSYIKVVDGLIEPNGSIEEESLYADLTYDESKKEDVDTSSLSSFKKSDSKHSGKLYTIKNIIPTLKKTKEGDGAASLFKHIFIAIMAIMTCALSFILYNKHLDEYSIKPYDESSVYINMKSYSELRRLDSSLYDTIDFYKLGYNKASFSYDNLKSLSNIEIEYSPKSIDSNISLEYGEMPESGEILISRSLAETLKKEIRIEELQSDESVMLMLFEGDYKVSGIVSGNTPYVYFNKVDYINFLGVYKELYITDNYNKFFTTDFIDLEKGKSINSYSAEICLYESNNPILEANQCSIEINRSALYKMMSDTTMADSLIQRANRVLIDSPEYMYITDSNPLYIRKLSLTRKATSADIKIYVTQDTIDDIFTYIQPNIDLLGSDESYYFEIKTTSSDQRSSLLDRLSTRGIRSIDIKGEYDSLVRESKSLGLSNTLIYTLAGVLVLLIYFFIEKSGSVKNTKEYGVYRAIGVSRGNLLYKESFAFILTNLITYTCVWLVSTIILSTWYNISNIGVGMFIAISILIYLIGALLMWMLSMLPYLFVIYKSPSRILAGYDI